MRHQAKLSSQNRSTGFTLVELLVVITIIGMLVALIIPAVNSARETARKNACLSNIGQLAKAMTAYEVNRQRYPGYLEPVNAVGGTERGYVKWHPGGTADQEYVGSWMELTDQREQSRIAWSAHLLPYVEQEEWWDNIQNSAIYDTANDERVRIAQLPVFLCASDSDLNNTPGAAGSTYVVNTGAWDYEDNGNYHDSDENGDTKDNGIFQNLVDGNVKTRSGDIADGASNTLMFGENIQKNATYSWLGVEPGNPGEQQVGMAWVVNNVFTQPENCSDETHQAPFNVEPDQISFPEIRPWYARPFAHHRDTFNVAFADGHTRSLSADLDITVYQQLLTTRGAKCVDPHADKGEAPSSLILEFRNRAPLSADDLK